MGEPHEIVAGPLELYLAPVGETFPDVDETPAGNWELVGTSGDRNYDEGGVVVTHGQTIEKFRPAGSTAARKAWRTEEELKFELTLVDISAAQYARTLNDATVDNDVAGPGTPGTDTVPLGSGTKVAEFALLARGTSPEDNAFAAQYEVARCIQAASPAPTFKKGTPASLACSFEALEDEGNPGTFGNLVIQTDAAESA